MTANAHLIAAVTVVGCVTACGAARPNVTAPTAPVASSTLTADRTLATQAEVEHEEIIIVEDNPQSIAAAVALVQSMDGWGAIEDAYAPVLECFNGRQSVSVDELMVEASSPIPPDFNLGWATVSTIEALEADADQAILLVRGASNAEGELSVMPDERIVVVRNFGDQWRIAGEANRNATGCMNERWAGIGDDAQFSTCDAQHRACLLDIDEKEACGGLGCACNHCLMRYEGCNDRLTACMAA